MMDDLISRQAAIDAMLQLQKEDDDLYGVHIPEGFDGGRASEALKQLPSVERKKGKWIKGVGENGVSTSLFCSECNLENRHWYEWNFCPNCGAMMEEN